MRGRVRGCLAAAQALWRGNGTAVVRLVPEVSLRFALHDQLLTMFSPTNGQPLGFQGKLAAGATAGAISAHLVCHLNKVTGGAQHFSMQSPALLASRAGILG